MGWHACPVGCFGQAVLSLALPRDGVSGARLVWRHLSFIQELQGPADPSIPPRWPCPMCPWTVRTSVCCSAITFQAGPGQRQGLSACPSHRFGDTSAQEGPDVWVLDGQGRETSQTTALMT